MLVTRKCKSKLLWKKLENEKMSNLHYKLEKSEFDICVQCFFHIRFVADGGWELLNGWLTDAKSSDNIPVIMELIKVFKQLPVTIDILKKNNTAKLIKQMTKGEGDESKCCKD